MKKCFFQSNSNQVEESDNESDNESEASIDNLEAGDSENIFPQNEIIFPWNINQDSASRARNGFGEGGRSLIVELPTNEAES